MSIELHVFMFTRGLAGAGGRVLWHSGRAHSGLCTSAPVTCTAAGISVPV